MQDFDDRALSKKCEPPSLLFPGPQYWTVSSNPRGTMHPSTVGAVAKSTRDESADEAEGRIEHPSCFWVSLRSLSKSSSLPIASTEDRDGKIA
jgi:hypothetical protein